MIYFKYGTPFKVVIMKHITFILFTIALVATLNSCIDQEAILYDRYLNLEEPRYYEDSLRMKKILKIHKKLYKKQPDNLIYFGNVFQMNCLLGNYAENTMLVENKMFEEAIGLNPVIYKNFYLALNSFREDRKSDYNKFLDKLNMEDLSHNPLLGYIAASCTNNDEKSDFYYPMMLDYVRFMPEKNTILRMIESDKCERFLELYRGICPMCEICDRNYAI